MGLSQSSIHTDMQVAEEKKVEQSVHNVQTSFELQIKAQDEIKVAEPTQTPNSSPTLEPLVESKKAEVFERYIEPPGKKIEVIPADVDTSADVIRKK